MVEPKQRSGAKFFENVQNVGLLIIIHIYYKYVSRHFPFWSPKQLLIHDKHITRIKKRFSNFYYVQ